MKLNLDIISDYLPKSFEVQRFGPVSKGLTLNLPMFYAAGYEIERDRLYIARSETLPKKPPKRAVVVCHDQRPPQEWVDHGCQILRISNCPSLFFVLNEINRIYEYFNEWDNKLRTELEAEDDFDIKTILNLGSMVLENPITVANGNMLKIFGTELVSHGDSDGFDILESNKHESVSSEMIKDACRLERIIKEPYMSQVTIDGKRNYCKNLYPSGYFAGCISINELNRPFRNSDFPLADHFFDYFQKAYAKYLRRKPYIELPGTAALKNLLNGIPLSSEELEEIELKEGEFWTCFKLKNMQTMNFLPVEYMCTSLNTLLPGRMYAVIDADEILGLLKLEFDEDILPQNTLDTFDAYLNRMGYIGGLSEAFFDIYQTGIYKKQADFALEIGSQSGEKKQIFRFSEYILQYILTRYDGAFPVKHLCPKGLLSLHKHSDESNIDLLQTLDTYLKNEMRITGTANELYLHRSSLVYRLNKIKKLLAVDLDDPDVRLYLRVCLYLMKNGI